MRRSTRKKRCIALFQNTLVYCLGYDKLQSVSHRKTGMVSVLPSLSLLSQPFKPCVSSPVTGYMQIKETCHLLNRHTSYFVGDGFWRRSLRAISDSLACRWIYLVVLHNAISPCASLHHSALLFHDASAVILSSCQTFNSPSLDRFAEMYP